MAARPPTKRPGRGWIAALRRSWRNVREDDLGLLAAALTYFSVLSLFPALLLLVSVLGLVGEPATRPLLDNLAGLAPGPARAILIGAIHGLQSAGSGAGYAGALGLVGALWAASGYVGGFIKASNAIYEVEERRPSWRLRPLQAAVTVAIVLLAAVTILAVVVTGPLARGLGRVVGAGDTAIEVWAIARWPLLALVASQLVGLLYRTAPEANGRGRRWISPGSLLAVALWVATSAAFTTYVTRFASYEVYGSLSGVMVFLLWLWLANLSILLGAELNAELEGARPARH
jgi:membrane protein